MTKIDDLGAEMRAQYEDDVWLGHLVWYYVPTDYRIKLKDWMTAIYGTPVKDLVPTPPRAVDAFKRAITKTKSKVKIPVQNHGEFTYKFMPRDRGHDESYVYRTITVEELDPSMHRLSYEACVDFAYDRRNERIEKPEFDTTAMASFPAEIQQLCETKAAQVQALYYEEMESLGPIKVRELIRQDIEHKMQGTLARPAGGVYFVSNEHLDRVDALDELVNGLGGPTFHQLPLINNAKQRQMLRSAFEVEAAGQVELLMDEMRQALQGKKGKITQARAKAYHGRFLDMTDRLATYSDLLNEGMENTATRLKALQTQVMEVFKRIED